MTATTNKLKRLITADKTASWLFLLPGCAVLLITAVAPLLYSLYISFFRYKITSASSMQWIGFGNYAALFHQKLFWISVGNTTVFAITSVFFEIFIGVMLAMMLANDYKRTRILISLLLIPMVMAPVASGTLWRMMLDRSTGVVNYFLSQLGAETVNFLGSTKYALGSVIFVDIWRLTPWVTIIVASALKGISYSCIEAAVVDGAGRFRIFAKIILPLLRPVLMIVLMMRITDAFKVFDTVYVMTSGGPGNSTEMLPNYIYNQALRYMNAGYGSALAFVFILAMGLVTFVLIRLRDRSIRAIR